MKAMKRIWAFALIFTLCLTMGAAPLLANDDQTKASSYEQVLENANKSVVAAYKGEKGMVGNNVFAQDDLYQMFLARNNVLLKDQLTHNAVIEKDAFQMLDVNFFAKDSVKVLAKRTIEGYLNGEKTEANAFYTSNTEGYVLTKKGGKWLITRVIDDTYGANPNLESFKKDFHSKDPLSLASLKGLSKTDLIKDFSGVDYLKKTTNPKAPGEITIYWNNQNVNFPDAKPYIKNGVTYAPARSLLTAAKGYDVVVQQDRPPFVVTIQKVPNIAEGDFSAIFTVGKKSYIFIDEKHPDGKTLHLRQAVKIVDGRLMLPVRTIGEFFGNVSWDGEKQAVVITSDIA